MDMFKNASSSQQQQDSAQQAQVWNLTSRSPSPLILFIGPVNDISTTWRLLYTVSEVTHTILREALLANGTGGATKFALAFVPPQATAPTGASFNQNYVVRHDELDVDKSDRWEFESGLRPGWRIYGYTDAAAGDYANISLSGVEITYQ